MPKRTLGAAWETFPFVNWRRQLSALSFARTTLGGISVGAGGVQLEEQENPQFGATSPGPVL